MKSVISIAFFSFFGSFGALADEVIEIESNVYSALSKECNNTHICNPSMPTSQSYSAAVQIGLEDALEQARKQCGLYIIQGQINILPEGSGIFLPREVRVTASIKCFSFDLPIESEFE